MQWTEQRKEKKQHRSTVGASFPIRIDQIELSNIITANTRTGSKEQKSKKWMYKRENEEKK